MATRSVKRFIKAIVRSGSYSYAAEFSGFAKPTVGNQLKSFAWKGMRFSYRSGTSDAFVAYECFLHGKRNAYYTPNLPKDVKCIVDVGANVGASVLFWKSIYPNAEIHCFEPIESNFEVLKKNCDQFKNVYAYNEALGDADGEITFIHSPAANNEGGWSVFQRGASGAEQKITLKIRESGKRLSELGVTQIDVLKVDTEGAERAIIKGLGLSLLKNSRYLCGELHGENDFELLSYLENNGFAIGNKKSPKSKLFNFEAVRD